ncbi:MAG: tRNA (adenosine(37)-N6)-threonylcarbamoyltransferase complex ATPase subunit type 1 TsaE [Variibacter sp.]
MLETIRPQHAERVLPSERATRQLAADVAAILKPGDTVALGGDLGAGKTTFARALIRHMADDETIEVPSPTFTLVQHYDLLRARIAHIDLFRIGDPSEVGALGLADLDDDAILLIEWPERADTALPEDRIEINFTLATDIGPQARRVSIAGYGAPAQRAEQVANFLGFIDDAGYGAAERVRMQGDASTRIYERLLQPGRSAILMNAPRRPDGPPVQNGLPYSAIAHLAEDVTPFVAMARGLRERGFSAPEIFAADLSDGLLILEDLGTEPVVAGHPPAATAERYAAAVDVLAALHREALPDTLPVAPRVTYQLPAYDKAALLIEVDLLLHWYFPQQKAVLSDDARAEFRGLWRDALDAAVQARPTWVMRDYHSPNLLWLPERQGVARVGLLDFQDAVMGPDAYDVVSLLQDARVDVAESLEESLISAYIKARRAADRDFDMAQFISLYGLMGAQRATKILGIFARLDRRDGKPQYIRHQPRVWRNLRRALAHPALRPLKSWYEAHVPAPRG